MSRPSLNSEYISSIRNNLLSQSNSGEQKKEHIFYHSFGHLDIVNHFVAFRLIITIFGFVLIENIKNSFKIVNSFEKSKNMAICALNSKESPTKVDDFS